MKDGLTTILALSKNGSYKFILIQQVFLLVQRSDGVFAWVPLDETGDSQEPFLF